MDIFTNSGVYEKAYQEALRKNSQVTAQVHTFKKELEDVRLNLEQNQKHLFQNIMVPIGSKALIKGKLVHTNEVCVNLGDRWFVKTSASRAIEICDRMIGRCNQNLEEIKKESSLLNSNLEVPQEFEVFPRGDVQDIIEEYDEETEKLWREKHRERVRDWKRHEAVNRISDTELFGRLNRLQEEEDEELADSDHKIKQENEVLSSTMERVKMIEENPTSDCNEDLISDGASFREHNAKKRVSFSGLDMTPDHPTASATTDPFIIRFKHSENEPKAENFEGSDEILSPSHIHRKFFQQFNPKSILKNKNECETHIITSKENLPHTDVVEERREETMPVREFSTVNVVGDIFERKPLIPVKTEKETRPLSTFKKLRTQNQQ